MCLWTRTDAWTEYAQVIISLHHNVKSLSHYLGLQTNISKPGKLKSAAQGQKYLYNNNSIIITLPSSSSDMSSFLSTAQINLSLTSSLCWKCMYNQTMFLRTVPEPVYSNVLPCHNLCKQSTGTEPRLDTGGGASSLSSSDKAWKCQTRQRRNILDVSFPTQGPALANALPYFTSLPHSVDEGHQIKMAGQRF